MLTLARTIAAENLSITIDDAAAAQDRVESLVAELLRVPVEDRPRLASEARFMVPEVATRFNRMAMAKFRQDLRLAHSHAHVATVISSSITQRLGVAAEVEFECWKTRRGSRMKKHLAVLLLVVLAAVPASAAREARETAVRESRSGGVVGRVVKKVLRQIRSLGDYPTVPIPSPKP